MLDDLDIIDCPVCGGTVRHSLDDVAKGRTVRCGRGHAVTLDNGGGAAAAAKATRDLDKALDGLSRTIKFRL